MKRRFSPRGFIKKPERSQYKSTKRSLLKSGHIFKIRAANEKRTTGHGQYKTYATLQVIENTGEGQCLFLSILQHLQNDKNVWLDREKVRSVINLRNDIVSYVIENWIDYVHGFYNFDDNFQKKMDKYQCPEYENIKKCQKLYKKYMTRSSTWGTHVELAAACKLYGFKCVLLRVVDEGSVTVSVMNDELLSKREFRPTCFILHTGNATGNDHFRFLKPVGNVFSVPHGEYNLSTIENVSTATLFKKKLRTTTHARYDFENIDTIHDNTIEVIDFICNTNEVTDYGKRVYGTTLIPWTKGQNMVWDETCSDTLAPSYVHLFRTGPVKVAKKAANVKLNKYKLLIEQNYVIVPFAVETLGPWCTEAIQFIDTLGYLIKERTREARANSFLSKELV